MPHTHTPLIKVLDYILHFVCTLTVFFNWSNTLEHALNGLPKCVCAEKVSDGKQETESMSALQLYISIFTMHPLAPLNSVSLCTHLQDEADSVPRTVHIIPEM